MSNKLFDLSSCNFLIGYLFNDTSLYFDDKFPLTKEDFYNDKQKRGSQFQRILFSTGYNLALKGAKEINEISVGEFVKGYREYMAILEENDYISFIQTIKELSNADDFSVYYNRVRKMSLLAEYDNLGWNIKKFFDVDKEEMQERGKLEGFSIDEIIEYFNENQFGISKKYTENTVNEEIQAGIGFEEIKEKFKESPYIGADLQSTMQTSLYRGWCKGQLILRSAPSGFGKTILSVGDLCTVCANEYWDDNKQEWIINKNKQGAGLFINTEMDLMTELTPMFVAWISNVSRSDIMDGRYKSKEDEERVDKAIKVLQESEIYLVDDPKFTLKSLYSTIKEYSYSKNIQFVVMDYLQDNGVIGKEMKKTHEIVARDTIILNMADSLKLWAREFNIGILTHTQLNGNEKTAEIIDESCLAGGKAVKNKIDCGAIIMYPRKSEAKAIDMLSKKRGFNNLKCNLVSHNYKVRFGKYGTNIKLYQNADLGTGRIHDLFATDVFNKPINIEKIVRD